jgi:hypothetical protein
MREADHLVAVSVRPADGAPHIASAIFLVDPGRELLLWTWAHRDRDRWYRATELMTWEVIRRALARGCTTFDLMGRGDFKAKFGAVLDGTKYRWVRSRYRWLRYLRALAERAFRLRQAALARWARPGRVGSRHQDGKAQ